MTEWIWLNGQVMPLAEARIGIEDRGMQYADGVYEVIRIYNGKPFTLKEHLDRLDRSADGLQIALPLNREDLVKQINLLIAKSAVSEGMVYLQLTRGQSPRNHIFPDVPPTLLFYIRQLPPVAPPGQNDGIKLLTVPDERWKRCWIKSIALLPNVLAKNAAIDQGYDEAIFIDNGLVTECSTANLFAVINGKLITHPIGPKVLPGITRQVILLLAEHLQIPLEERELHEAELFTADEVFITSTTRELSWVTKINDHPIGQGHCGPITLKLHKAYAEKVIRETR